MTVMTIMTINIHYSKSIVITVIVVIILTTEIKFKEDKK